MNTKISEIIHRFQLAPHPEGGHYKRTTESATTITANGHSNRPIITGIYYLLSGSDFSCFHRIDSNEVWNYHAGNTYIRIHIIHPTGDYELAHLGPEYHYQFCVPAGCWFAAELEDKNEDNYVLSGCIVSPGFLFDTFEMATYQQLRQQHPTHEPIIRKMTRSPEMDNE